MRFLIDEMFSSNTADCLVGAGHDAVHVHGVGLAGVEDGDVLVFAANEDRVVVTENAADFVPLLDGRTAAGLALVPVVIALKRNLPAPAGAMHHALAEQLALWAEKNPDPYRHVHWLG